MGQPKVRGIDLLGAARHQEKQSEQRADPQTGGKEVKDVRNEVKPSGASLAHGAMPVPR